MDSFNYLDNKGYDASSPMSIEMYAQGMIGMTFNEILKRDIASMVKESVVNLFNDNKYKGSLGTLIEEHFFHYPANSDPRPDFHEAEVELKVTPYKRNSDGSKSAKERLILTMIDYNSIVNETFEKSHLWYKAKTILLVYYLYVKDVKKLDYQIDYARLFTPPQNDLVIIKQDYEKIAEKVRQGKAHELSESDTLYLGAATKSQTSNNRREQPFSNIQAKPRAFAFKTSYMTYVLNNYIINKQPKFQSILHENVETTFEDYVVNRINQYLGKTVLELSHEFGIDDKKKPKNLESLLAFKMLGVEGNQAEEFVKAGIVVKAIRINERGTIKESMSFPTFKYIDIINETWESSAFRRYLDETRFFFIIYGTNENKELFLDGSMFWCMPQDDLENHVRKVWEKTQKIIMDGLIINYKNGVRHTNLPKASEDPVCHVRPHGQNANDTFPLPDGRTFTKQCFWLNNTYILQQLLENINTKIGSKTII